MKEQLPESKPEKEEAEKRNRFVQIRFTHREFAALERRKSTTQARDLSTFIRTICLDKPMRMKPQLTTHQEKVSSILHEIRTDVLRISVNINQSSKRINATTDNHDLQREVKAMANKITRIESELNAVLKMIKQEDPAVELENIVLNGSSN